MNKYQTKSLTLSFFVLMVAVFALLYGCTTEYDVIQKTHNVYIPVGKNLTSKIIPPGYPDHDNYVQANATDRTEILNDYIGDLYKVIKDLNNRLGTIADQDVKNAKLVNDTNAKEEQRVKDLTSKLTATVKNL